MPEPTFSLLHVDQPLSELATAVFEEDNTAAGFVGLNIAPVFPTNKLTGSLWELDIESMFRGDDNREGPDGYLQEIEWHDTLDTFKAQRHGRKRWISDVEEDVADDLVKPSRAATRILMRQNMISLERQIIGPMTTAANYLHTTTLAGGDQWNNAGANIELHVQTAKQTPLIPPNAVALREDVWSYMKRNTSIKAMFQYTGQGAVPDALLKEILGVQYVFLAKARYATNDRNASFANDYIFPKDVLFFNYDPRPNRGSFNTAWTFWYKHPSFGGPAIAGTQNPFYVKRVRDEERGDGGTNFLCAAWYDPAWIANTHGAYLIKSAIA